MVTEEEKRPTLVKTSTKKTNVRWVIPVMLFIAITFNYADREIWTLTAPAFSYAFGWTSSIGSYGITETVVDIFFLPIPRLIASSSTNANGRM